MLFFVYPNAIFHLHCTHFLPKQFCIPPCILTRIPSKLSCVFFVSNKNSLIYIYGVGQVWVQLVGFQGADARVILVLRDNIWNALSVLLVLPAFDGTGSLDYPQCWEVYHQTGSTLVSTSRFLEGNKEAKLKPTTFFTSIFQCFSVFILLLTPPGM